MFVFNGLGPAGVVLRLSARFLVELARGRSPAAPLFVDWGPPPYGPGDIDA